MPAPNRAIATAHGTYLVQGLDRFALGGNLDVAVAAAVDAHHARCGAAPKAVVWDDAVLSFRPHNCWFGLARVFIPYEDPFIAAALDSTGRAAVRADAVPGGDLQTSDALGTCGGREVAHAPFLARLVGWPHAAPLRDAPPPAPSHRARSISAVINYRDKADTTIAALHHLRRQRLDASLEVILVDNRSAEAGRAAVAAAAARLFDGVPGYAVRHVRFDEAFDHSRQCNVAAAEAHGDVLLMLSNDCNLLDADTAQTLADWAMAPNTGAVGPRLVGDDGQVACAGMALGPRTPGGGDLRIHEAEVPYLSEMVRRSNGASFACAAIARTTWARLGGADTAEFRIDYNDADFCLRATQAGLDNLYIGTVRAHHHPGMTDVRTRTGAEALHAQLAERRAIHGMPRLNPAALPVKSYPPFGNPHADALCDHIRLYRRALAARDTGPPLAAGVMAAFEQLHDTAHRPDDGSAAHEQALDGAIRAVTAAFLGATPAEQVPDRYRRSFDRLPGALEGLAAMRRRPVSAIPLPAGPHAAQLLAAQAAAPAAPAEPEEAQDFLSHTDRAMGAADERLLIFADAMGPSQQILFLEGLKRARATRRCAVRIMTEDDLRRLRTSRGSGGLRAWLGRMIEDVRPTAIVFSRFADQEAYRAIGEVAAALDVPHLAHIDDDFFSLPAVIGVDRYREARHPRRIHCLHAVAADADLILASTPLLAERLGGLFGMAKVALCPMHEGGECGPRRSPAGPPVIGYFGSATHNRDLDLIAPALRRLKTERPELVIEIVGSVARRSTAAGLGDLIVRKSALEADYARFRTGMREWNWTVGLAPLVAHPFNAAKTPVKWTEYASAGIPVIASRTEPYLELARRGALLPASPGEWHGRISALLDREERREALLDASGRLLRGFDGWGRMERRLLGLLVRARDRRRLAAAA